MYRTRLMPKLPGQIRAIYQTTTARITDGSRNSINAVEKRMKRVKGIYGEEDPTGINRNIQHGVTSGENISRHDTLAT
jgi:hypothetical protein